ncbi:scavenger receptor cysteine-rich type 1 protein M130-like isoform X10 [Poecile atricapillus]|uniref:scavenger receptor cysteine-rich type 1 protein M130-like isoform X10 n=1 Tax=Poecile atricapillus TaxID=48891 RepID=UPI002739D898|nr:scavenger receptor cysteine-rich type 1 protein M130-like isoform X10 [Poecile atricapillus]
MGPMVLLGLLLCTQLRGGECRAAGIGAGLGSLGAAGSGELRLVGGGGRCAGRVEVKHGGEWGSVCIFDFDFEDRWATVVCRQLGCGRVAKASPYAPFGQGSGRIWLQPFFCRGTEDALQECPHFGWGEHFCGHERDVGVICTDGVELRLAGGGSPCAGRVEVKLQGRWGSVGDDSWDMEDAEVVCQQLGCGSAAGAYFVLDRFDPGDGPVNMAMVDCRGFEATLWDCEIRGWGPYNISFRDFDTAVVCTGFSRLVGGDGACAGQLEVRQGRAWLGVCEDQVDAKAAQVVCRELGCGPVLSIPGSGRFGAASGSLWDGGFQCHGTEPLLSACARRPPRGRGCSGPGSVICSPYTSFRLENGSSACSGRVEVELRGTWGSVCASEWDLPDAHVLCRHLGCGSALGVSPGGSFGSGEGPLRPDAFGCSGSERHPGECPVTVLGKPPCAPGNAAAVKCSGVVEPLRLVEGETRCDGWLEVATKTGAKRRVPGDLLLLRNFSKVCWELGCGELDESNAVPGNVTLRDINATEWAIMESVIITILGKTTALTEWPDELPSYLFQDQVPTYFLQWLTTAPAGVPHGTYLFCSGGCPEKGRRWWCPRQPCQRRPCVPAGSRRVRLVGSSGRCAGLVEVYWSGGWSSVCQEGWDVRDAAVVCRELGCGTALEAASSARFGAGTGPLWPYAPECSGSEEALWQCGLSERRECGRGGGAGAVCSGERRAAPAEAGAGPGGVAGRAVTPPVPLQSSSRCGWRAAAGAAGASWRCPTTAPGAACAPTAPAPAPPAPSAASWAAGTGAGCRPSPARSRPVPGWPGWAARTGAARSGGAPRQPGTCRAAALAGTPTWLARRTATAPLRQTPPHIQRVPPAQVAVPVPAWPTAGWLGSPSPHAWLCSHRCPQQKHPGSGHGDCACANHCVRGAGDAAVPDPGCPGCAAVPCPCPAARCWQSCGCHLQRCLRGAGLQCRAGVPGGAQSPRCCTMSR